MRLLSSALVVASFGFGSAAAGAQEAAPALAEIRKIDVHSHFFEDIPQLNAMLRRLNFRTILVCNVGTQPHVETQLRIATELTRKYPDLYAFTSTFDLMRRNEPDYVAGVISRLGRTFADGAVAVKIWKEIGMEIKRSDGRFILPDDPLFDPIYAFIAQRGKLLHTHLAEPLAAWLPLDKESPYYGYYSQHPEWHLHGKPEFPSHAALIAARDNILKKHPDLIVLGAHLGSLEHDLDGIAERLDRYPNFYIECAARTRHLVRHPSGKVRAFFLKYQDRILYGVDAGWRPYLGGKSTDAMRKSFVDGLEKRYRTDFAYYAGQGKVDYDGRTVEGLNLPRRVLEKFYHENAERLYRLNETKK